MNTSFTKSKAVTPSDTELIEHEQASGGAWLFVGTPGDIRVQTVIGDIVTFTAHQSGYMPGKIVKVFATGTTADNIIALWA